MVVKTRKDIEPIWWTISFIRDGAVLVGAYWSSSRYFVVLLSFYSVLNLFVFVNNLISLQG